MVLFADYPACVRTTKFRTPQPRVSRVVVRHDVSRDVHARFLYRDWTRLKTTRARECNRIRKKCKLEIGWLNATSNIGGEAFGRFVKFLQPVRSERTVCWLHFFVSSAGYTFSNGLKSAWFRRIMFFNPSGTIVTLRAVQRAPHF